MKKAGSILTLLGSIFGMLAAIFTLFFGGVGAALGGEGAAGIMAMGLFGILLSITLFVLSILSFSCKDDKIPIVMLILSVANIIVGGTFVAVCMVINVVGAILLVVAIRKEMTAQNPDATQKRFYKQWWFWVSLAVLLLSILFASAATSEGETDTAEAQQEEQAQQKEVTPANVEVRTTANEMISIYDGNKVQYDTKFAGKIAEIEGEVNEVTGSEDEFIVKLRMDIASDGFSMNDVALSFKNPPQPEKDVLMRLTKGNRVKAIGLVAKDNDLFDLSVVNCKLAQ